MKVKAYKTQLVASKLNQVLPEMVLVRPGRGVQSRVHDRFPNRSDGERFGRFYVVGKAGPVARPERWFTIAPLGTISSCRAHANPRFAASRCSETCNVTFKC